MTPYRFLRWYCFCWLLMTGGGFLILALTGTTGLFADLFLIGEVITSLIFLTLVLLVSGGL